MVFRLKDTEYQIGFIELPGLVLNYYNVSHPVYQTPIRPSVARGPRPHPCTSRLPLMTAAVPIYHAASEAESPPPHSVFARASHVGSGPRLRDEASPGSRNVYGLSVLFEFLC